MFKGEKKRLPRTNLDSDLVMSNFTFRYIIYVM